MSLLYNILFVFFLECCLCPSGASSIFEILLWALNSLAASLSSFGSWVQLLVCCGTLGVIFIYPFFDYWNSANIFSYFLIVLLIWSSIFYNCLSISSLFSFFELRRSDSYNSLFFRRISCIWCWNSRSIWRYSSVRDN